MCVDSIFSSGIGLDWVLVLYSSEQKFSFQLQQTN